MRRSRWIKALLVLYMLPWALPALPAFLSLHWMFIGYGGFLNSALEALFDIDGPIWFNSYWLAMGANILAYIWKWMPFWTLVFLAGRMAIPQDIYEAAAVDGATGIRRFTFVTFPLLANLYLDLHAALHAVDDRRLHHRVFRLQRRAGLADGSAGHVRLPRGIRPRLSGARRGGGDVGAAGADPARDPADAAAAGDGGAVVSLAMTSGGRARRPRYRLRRILTNGGSRGVRRDPCDLDDHSRLQHAADRAQRGRRRIHRHGLAERSVVRELPGDLDRGATGTSRTSGISSATASISASRRWC